MTGQFFIASPSLGLVAGGAAVKGVRREDQRVLDCPSRA
jgi:hypothetical protein